MNNIYNIIKTYHNLYYTNYISVNKTYNVLHSSGLIYQPKHDNEYVFFKELVYSLKNNYIISDLIFNFFSYLIKFAEDTDSERFKNMFSHDVVYKIYLSYFKKTILDNLYKYFNNVDEVGKNFNINLFDILKSILTNEEVKLKLQIIYDSNKDKIPEFKINKFNKPEVNYTIEMIKDDENILYFILYLNNNIVIITDNLDIIMIPISPTNNNEKIKEYLEYYSTFKDSIIYKKDNLIYFPLILPQLKTLYYKEFMNFLQSSNSDKLNLSSSDLEENYPNLSDNTNYDVDDEKYKNNKIYCRLAYTKNENKHSEDSKSSTSNNKDDTLNDVDALDYKTSINNDGYIDDSLNDTDTLYENLNNMDNTLDNNELDDELSLIYYDDFNMDEKYELKYTYYNSLPYNDIIGYIIDKYILNF